MIWSCCLDGEARIRTYRILSRNPVRNFPLVRPRGRAKCYVVYLGYVMWRSVPVAVLMYFFIMAGQPLGV